MKKILRLLTGITLLQGCGAAPSPLVNGNFVNTELIDYPEAGIDITAFNNP